MIIAFIPRFLLRRLVADQAAAWPMNVVVSHTALLLAIPLAPVLLDMIGNWPHACLSRELIGFFPIGLLALLAGRKPTECPKCQHLWQA